MINTPILSLLFDLVFLDRFMYSFLEPYRPQGLCLHPSPFAKRAICHVRPTCQIALVLQIEGHSANWLQVQGLNIRIKSLRVKIKFLVKARGCLSIISSFSHLFSSQFCSGHLSALGIPPCYMAPVMWPKSESNGPCFLSNSVTWVRWAPALSCSY